jgi:glucose-1-phosphate thymidylyltransferase
MDKMDKIVVLARGLGSRMRRSETAAGINGRQAAMADAGIKAMIPIGRPFLDYVLSAAADAGFRHVCLVIGPEHSAIREYYGGQTAQRLDFAFACQTEPKGTADAVAAAREFADREPFAVINSDNFYPVEALRGLREQSGCAAALFERDAMLAGGNVPAERIKRFAVAKIDPLGRLERILEKPDEAALAALPKPLWVSMNCWRFGPSIFEACGAIRPSPRGEYEITDAVQHAISKLGETFAAVKIRAPVLDLTSRDDIASVAALLTPSEVRL